MSDGAGGVRDRKPPVACDTDAIAASSRTDAHKSATRRLRLASGSVMLVYLALHMTNHSLGLVSLDAAERGLEIAKAVWQSWPGTLALYGSAATHIALALHTLYQRPHWQLPPIEWVRLWAGFSLPLLLIDHVVHTRVALIASGFDPHYCNVIATIIANGHTGWQLALIAPGWVHGCLGVRFALRRHAWAARIMPPLVAIAIILPLTSAFGFLSMRSVVQTATSMGEPSPSSQTAVDPLERLRRHLEVGYLMLIAASVVAGVTARRSARRTTFGQPT